MSCSGPNNHRIRYPIFSCEVINPGRAVAFFVGRAEVDRLIPLAGGNVNRSWLLVLKNSSRQVLQRLNPAVFPDPGLIMANLRLVSNHLHDRLQKRAVTELEIIRLLPAKNGAVSFTDPEGGLWRMLSYISGTRSRTTLATTDQAAAIGRTLALFHLLLADLDPALLGDPLPGFHVTPRYLADYDRIVQQRPPATDRERFCDRCIEALRPQANLLEDARHRLRRQVIHADPKVANFLFARDTDRVVSLIDLDTVAPGLLLHDLGDCLRSCCNRQGEEIDDPGRVRFDTDLCLAMLTGYSREAGHLLTVGDRSLVLVATHLITLELGLRFFSDHLAGNRYFTVNRPDHNLHRALVQFHLARSIAQQERELTVRLKGILQ